MKQVYKIYDWAGNDLSVHHGCFKTFDDAWNYIYGEMTDKLGLSEEDYQEYYVELDRSRPSNYLDPKDPTFGYVKNVV